jgi:hypothetical protein
MKPIIEVAEKGAEQPVAAHDAEEGQRDRRQDDQRQLERAELRDHEDVDPEQGHHEGRAHVAEGHPGDFPFAVPQQRRLPCSSVGLAVKLDRRLGAFRPVHRLERVGDGEHAVERRFVGRRPVRP